MKEFENKANLPDKLLKPYHAAEVETPIYKRWEDSGFFNPDVCVEHGVTKSDAEHFSIVLPPPNVTGVLHLGHAYEDSLQDTLIRYHRMRGKKTLWIPGTDSAAIATQARVEKDIQKNEGKSRHDLGREELVRRVSEFAKGSENTILSQVRHMGASLDWSRYAYTLDDERNRAVFTAFKNMYDAGLIYRGNRIVNWDPKGQTTVSDDEIVYEERDAMLYTFKYSKDFPISISTTRPETKVGDTAVAVHPDDVRYKDLIGNVYEIPDFCGVALTIKIIADKSIDPEFGTGALGVTPAHSMIDWEMAEKNNLPVISVINEYAKMSVGDERILGKKVAEAREIIVEWLRNEGLLEKEESIKQNAPTAERTGGIIEPLPKLQWFIAVDKKFTIPYSKIPGIANGSEITLKELMKTAVESGGVSMPQENFRKTYFNWINNLHDWCISRQIWFGHRIPVWYKNPIITWDHKFNRPTKFEDLRKGTKKFEIRAGKSDGWADHKPGDIIRFTLVDTTPEENPIPGVLPVIKKLVSIKKFSSIDAMLNAVGLENIVPGMSHEEYIKAWTENPAFMERISAYGIYAWELEDVQHEIYCGLETPSGEGWEQDPDVLDTWFSSALWTFSTMGWPDQTPDLKYFHPTSFMCPAYEILALWVSRMILMSGFHLGQIPFKTAMFHGIVRDASGRKFSKSLGNGIDPLDIITKYGADALRMGLLASTAIGNDIKFDEQKVKAYSKFANKMWNATRFVLENIYDLNMTEPMEFDAEDQTSMDELQNLLKEITGEMEEYKCYLVADKLYHYFWHTFADILIERSKKKISDGSVSAKWLLYMQLTTLIKALHPFMPFITEEIWGLLPHNEALGTDKKMLIIESWPE